VRKPARLPLEALAPYLLDPAAPGSPKSQIPNPKATVSNLGFGTWDFPAQPVDWPAVFGNTHPVEIEVGFGKGLFLVTAGQARPDTNFLGIEALRGLQLYAATRLAKRNLRNVRVACADARTFFRDRVPSGSVGAVHVYFPDPWWKKRHHKRRVWTPEFADQCVRVLRPGGRLLVATDVGDYYRIIRELLDGRPGLRLESAAEQTGPPAAGEVLTNFERKARQKGGSVFRAEYERAGGGHARSCPRGRAGAEPTGP
jgi:tRNA (guanine-N7-)-methyltransferase